MAGSGGTSQARLASQQVPFVDLAAAHAELKAAVLDDVARLIDEGSFVNGPAVAEFEAAFAAFCGAPHCVGLASGLDALRLALIAIGVGPGDEVVVPANTFVATFEAVSQTGATPVPVDAGEDDYNVDVDAAAAATGPRTKAIVPVHLYGQLADVVGLEELARRTGVALVEDACQAHGATRDDRTAGTVGVAAAFSFYPAKNLGAFGDAGALTTLDGEVAEAVRALREHGQREKYRHVRLGYTARLDTIQALVLARKLPLLDSWNQQRRAAAAAYRASLDGVGDLVLPPEPEGSVPVYHLFAVRTAQPERLAAFLGERGVATGRHYPEPPHLSAAYEHLGLRRGAFPVTERLAAEQLSLPIFPGISEAQIDAVCGAIAAYFDG